MKSKNFYLISIIIIFYFLFNNINKSDLNTDYKKYISEKTLENIIDNNIAATILGKERIDNNQKTFYNFKVIDISKNNDKFNIYLWILAQNFSVKNNILIKGIGGEFPVILKLK